MRVSINWLKEYLDVQNLSPEEIANKLTDLGLEVESIHHESSVPKLVTVGQIVAAQAHPDADSLQLCQVDIGAEEHLQIVCGAPNARQGLKVAVAQVGCELPGDFKIKKSKIRGQASFGMLCSQVELGLGTDSDGILELKESATVGSPLGEALGLADVILEIGLTPNRADCLGVIGIARDLAAKLETKLILPPSQPAFDTAHKSNEQITLDIQDKEGCSRFVASYIKGVKTTPSPQWMQQRLLACGMRPINLIVDVTNYVMLEYGQPIHAYDIRDVTGKKIIVRRASASEKIKTLDKQEHTLNSEDLLICDESGPIGLAGIMGGANSEVKDDTTEIIVEVAYFAPLLVRKTARRLGMHTEASHRFERGVNISNTKIVSDRVSYLLQKCSEEMQVAVPVAFSEPIDNYFNPVVPSNIALRLSKTQDLLALPNLTKQTVIKHLEALEFRLLDQNEDRMVFEIPMHRVDIIREVDLIEEVARLEGLDTIPYQMPEMNIRPNNEDSFIDFADEARTQLAGLSLRETISFPFVSLEEMSSLNIEAEHPLFPSVILANPLSEEHKYMQTSLIPNLVKATVNNRRRGENGTRLFECARAYHDFEKAPVDSEKYPLWKKIAKHGRHLSLKAKSETGRTTERNLLAGILDTPYKSKGWDSAEVPVSFFHGKDLVLKIGRAFSVDFTLEPLNGSQVPFLHPGASAQIMKGQSMIGYIGELHPRTSALLGFGADKSPVVFEIDLEKIYDLSSGAKKYETVLNRFPPVTRDLAFLVPVEKTHNDFENAIAKFKKKRNLNNYNLFDIYEGENVPDGKKSMAYTFAFQSPEKTLTDKEVESEINNLINWLGTTVDATQR